MTGADDGRGNPLRDERAMFAVLLRVLGIAGVVMILAALVSPTVGALAGLLLVGVWIGLVISRRRTGSASGSGGPGRS